MEKGNILTEMTVEERVGQLFHLGIEGTEITPMIKTLIQQYAIGGVILFGRNIQSPDQVRRLTQQLQELAIERGLPLLISIDEEGGVVTRLKGGTHFPGLMSLGATNDSRWAYRAGKMVAKELKSVGINMNLAPVLDVNNNPKNPVIGVRSFGEDPLFVAELGAAYIEGMQSEGIIACGKHFPGHGDTEIDSHKDLPVIQHSLEYLQEVELYPFQEAMKSKVDAIMTAHIYFQALDPERRVPATLSANVLQGLLRERMGFKGLILTDCMEMEAIAANYTAAEGSIKTLKAGSDMVLISHSIKRQIEAIEGVLQAVKNRVLSLERLDSSVQRIISLKKRRLSPRSTEVKEGLFHREEAVKLAREIAAHGITLVRDRKGLLPIERKRPTLLLESPYTRRTDVEEGFCYGNLLGDLLKERGVILFHHVLQRGHREIPSLSKYQQLLLITIDVQRDREQVALVKRLHMSSLKPIIIALRNPYDLLSFKEVSTYLTTYDPSPHQLVALCDILLGDKNPRGQLPITIHT